MGLTPVTLLSGVQHRDFHVNLRHSEPLDEDLLYDCRDVLYLNISQARP